MTIVTSGEHVSSATFSAGQTQTVLDGGVAVSTTLLSGGSASVLYGGVESYTAIDSSGVEFVSGGTVYAATVNNGGALVVSSGDVYSTVVNSGGGEFVSGGSSFGTTVNSGGTEALPGGEAVSTTVNGSGQMVVSGGVAFDTLVTSGGSVFVSNGAIYDTVVDGSNASDVISAGAAYSTTVNSGGTEFVLAGAVYDATVNGGGVQAVSGGAAYSTTVDASGIQAVSGGNTFATVVSSGGAEYVTAGTALATVLDPGGALVVLPGGVASAPVIDTMAALALSDGAVVEGGIAFAGVSALLEIGGTAMPTVPIAGFVKTDLIDLTDIAPGSGAAVSIDSATDVLTVSAGGALYTLDLAGDYAGATFAVSSDGVSGSYVEVACFAAGTRIATPSGEAAVEALAPGALVLTQRGRAAPVRWVGHRRVDCRRHARPEQVRPVRIAAGAFAPAQPRRALLLSPDHAVHCDGVLIPVRYLVNGRTIAPLPVDRIDYHHVELDRHDVLLAEGLPAESFLDTGNRAAFVGGGAALELHPEFSRRVWREQGCAELVLSGPLLAAVRRRLLARAETLGHRLTCDPELMISADGRRLAAQVEGAWWGVALPAGATTVTLHSRIWTPAHADPGSDDTRALGVALDRLALDGRPVALDSPALAEGWQAAEGEWRWTDGAARIPVIGVRHLAFRLAMSGRHWAASPPIAGESDLAYTG